MYSYIFKRLLLVLPTLLFIYITVFTLIRLVPGDAASMLLADVSQGSSSSEAAQVLREKLGLNRPYHQAFLLSLRDLLRGDLGKSLRTGDPVGPELLRRIPVSLELTILSMAIALLIGVPAGIFSAIKADSPVDYLARFFSIGALSVPNFWLGIMLIVLPFQLWSYVPPINYVGLTEAPWTNLRIMVVPALALGAGLSAGILRITRTNILEVIRQDYIRTARAKGLDERVVIVRHVLKNALIPAIEIVVSQFGRLLSGVVIMEVLFSLPGIGRATVDAVVWRDYIALQSYVLFATIVVLALHIIADMVYAWMDPRIHYG